MKTEQLELARVHVPGDHSVALLASMKKSTQPSFGPG